MDWLNTAIAKIQDDGPEGEGALSPAAAPGGLLLRDRGRSARGFPVRIAQPALRDTTSSVLAHVKFQSNVVGLRQ